MPWSGSATKSLYGGTMNDATHSEGRSSSADCQLEQRSVAREHACERRNGRLVQHQLAWLRLSLAMLARQHNAAHASQPGITSPTSSAPGHPQHGGVVVQQRAQQADLGGGARHGVALPHAAGLANHV